MVIVTEDHRRSGATGDGPAGAVCALEAWLRGETVSGKPQSGASAKGYGIGSRSQTTRFR